MTRESSFLVEEFLAAIASQLDRTQDTLALKAVNRPLTYAIKDFNLDLKVFVEMDPHGQVRLRSPAPNESGASTISIGFTTITRPMIQENTVSAEMSRAPDLAQAGLAPEERQRLEQLGVRNTAELQRLQNTTGTGAIARLADVPVERIRSALALGQPQLTHVSPVPPLHPAHPPEPRHIQPPHPPVPLPPSPTYQPPHGAPPPRPAVRRPAVISIPPGTQRLELHGRNMLPPDDHARVRLDNQPLAIAESDEDRLVVELPENAAGALEVDLGSGNVTTYQLEPEHPAWAQGTGESVA